MPHATQHPQHRPLLPPRHPRFLPRWSPRAGRAALLLAAALLPACTPRSSIHPVTPSTADFAGRAIQNPGPFAPVTLRIHPLTHIADGPGGQPLIVCHLEFKDRWHHTVKAAGPLELQLYRPVTGLRADVDRQDLRWPIELDDLERNADWFDPVTNTYRIQLQTPPGLIPPATGQATVRLRAVFIARSPDGAETDLLDDFVIQR